MVSSARPYSAWDDVCYSIFVHALLSQLYNVGGLDDGVRSTECHSSL